MERVAVLGFGIVGARVWRLLVDAGYTVSCWSRTQRVLSGETKSPETAVEGLNLVSLYLKDVVMVREVFAKAMAGLKRGALVMNHSTIDLPTTLWLADLEFLGAGEGI